MSALPVRRRQGRSIPAHRELREILRRNRVFDAIAADLNASLDIPCPMVVGFTAR